MDHLSRPIPRTRRSKANNSPTRGGTKLPAEQYLPYWYQADEGELGLFLRVTERRLFIAQLYEARKRAEDPRLEALMIFQPGKDLVYIAKKEVELDAD